ncbi:replication initiation and membrane attachment family protein [Virgibacillus xinjiangensis]|uniref:Replication initiation and membrane attachment family protein n=1 Tax=Virgibacillus xinjiangensis TaxID=393090 RepID=A0ABV7CV06_9BACI
MNNIGKILPVEGYHIVLKQNLPADYAKSLTHLYQPLIGIQAIMLYQTLLHDMDIQSKDNPQTHHTLMNYLNLPLDEIYLARRKLEGIGLVKTYKQQAEPHNIYTYILHSPFSPVDFFKDAMLSQLLYHHIGKDKFHLLKEHYKEEKADESGEDVTASFNEVFQTFTPSSGYVHAPEPAATSKAGGGADFTWMEDMLKQRMIPVERVLTGQTRRLINQMIQLYDLAAHEVDKAVLWSLDEENRLNGEEFKTACHDLFKAKNQSTAIHLEAKAAKSPEPLPNDKPLSKEEQLVHQLETISPKQLLEDLSSGSHASEQDLKVIRDIMTSQGLPSPVMNVLIHYVLLQTNMKLSKAYLEKIASHWSRANLKTAKEAMAFAKKEKVKYEESVNRRRNKRKPAQEEVVPEWFKNRHHKKTSSAGKQENDSGQEQQKIEALLRQISSKK